MSAQIVEPVAEGATTSAGRDLPPSMVERMSLILDAFESPAARLTLEQVSRATHLPRSTAHRILDQLVRLEWLAHTSFGFSLGPRSLGLGGGGRADTELREAAAPYLHELQVRTGLVAHLAVLDGPDVRYLDKIGGRFAVRVPSRVGGHAAAHATALGKAILAWLPAERVDEIVDARPARLTKSTITDLALLHQELHRIRGRHGVAYERGEAHPDIACVAAAIRSPEGAVGAVSLVGDLRAPVERVAPLVLRAARQTAADLFPQPEAAPAPAARPARTPAPPATQPTWSAATMERLVADAASGAWV
ncbi:IclR family transcriptional regulator [Nocardioides nitrophenolicus]|uniref:IclR family transcriptional regulator n=1 Tax=Nocardioides nitrophenolicus TaxID=60489 RepID=UPI00195D459C|nr:IclR family transcriptional regulator [Nocardioides nitrophenolicus]MBM7519608.1 DNA-binding IclR family transcriptional regulator [Nocardioides nitrophenolicus]